MTLSRKTLIYTFIISLLVMAFFASYLLWLLPGLYVEHINQAHIDDFQAQHLSFLDKGSYDGIESTNPVTSISLVLPKASGDIRVHSIMLDARIVIRQDELQAMIDQWQRELLDFSVDAATEPVVVDLSRQFQALFQRAIDELPFDMEVERYRPIEFSPDDITYDFRRVSSSTRIIALAGRFDSNDYMNLIAVTDQAEHIVMSWSSVVTGSIDQIRPVTTQSLPMITLVVLVIVTLASYLFARRIVEPITQVSHHARDLMAADYQPMAPLKLRGGDEITSLAEDLDALYERLRTQYDELAHEHTRQEVVLRSSSHQLKTPITASLLLVEGMMNRVGRYADHQANLPLVREQLMAMQQMVESLLSLQAMDQTGEKETIRLADFLDDFLKTYRELAATKGIRLQLKGDKTITADPAVLTKLFDPILSNAISYSAPGGRVEIRLDQAITLTNSPARIDDEVLAHALEPFVSSHRSPGRGLGLYLAKHYATLLGWQLSLEQSEERVTIRLSESSKTHSRSIRSS
ncbi:MAG TPA: HAMP domain-containing histidine kinase [Tissierellia bacterium]|nr:HAMP domain-containing histidine kinase [Tissierellia bacterium]